MTESAPWEALLEAHFAGYLLGRAGLSGLSNEAASGFLERVGGDDRSLYLVRAVSAVAPHAAALRDLALLHVPSLARELSPRADLYVMDREGPMEGRVDVAATLKRRLEGRTSRVVTRPRRPRFSRPEDALLKAVTARAAVVLADLRAAGLLTSVRVFEGLDACEEALRRALTTTALRDVVDEPMTPRHEAAALAAGRPGYAIAAALYRSLHDALEAPDPAATARAVAEGALSPLEPPTRFELAVLLQLLRAIEGRLDAAQPTRWELRRTAILPDRADVASFERDDGASVRLFFNQSWLPAAAHDRGARRYLGQRGRLRPDITVIMHTPSTMVDTAAVIECKLSDDPEYIAQGYRQALLYRHEFADALKGWPKAVLVASSPLVGEPSREDDVIALGWERWAPDAVIDGLLEDLLR